MEIDINQKKISIGDKFQIFVDRKQTSYRDLKNSLDYAKAEGKTEEI